MDNIKIITEHWDKIDPKKIADYVAVGGYETLRKFVCEADPASALQEIKKSGLLGRGGAGFPIGDKLELVASSNKKEKYFICNLDESEPGTYKDREIAKNNPHLLIEGIALASLIIGAKKAFIYLNGNYEEEEEILECALSQSIENGFIGEGILGSEYGLEMEVFQGAGAYICGEETALLNSIEGRRGEPRLRPPYPTDKGLWGHPTAIGNAETVSNFPWIIKNGGAEYSRIGSADSPGTKLYTLGGSVKNTGIFELPTGISIRDLIQKSGGGMMLGKEFWFAQIGGASGRLVLENELEEKLVLKKGAKIPLGSGAVLVVDKTVDIHDMILSWTGFFRRESCGKCVPCREGTFRLFEIAKRMNNGKMSERDKAAVSDILWALENTTFCPFGKFSATAFRDTVEKLNISNS
ncbi:MAG: NADH-quinone oxidoreductase subunit F [Candidatus Moranbacteria bacterium]|nr:NADH-quinone oxidoreductase subunit F [Candidatus Moranbacteria bacterium]